MEVNRNGIPLLVKKGQKPALGPTPGELPARIPTTGIEDQRIRGCVGKKKYSKYIFAWQDSINVERNCHKAMNVYHCKFCSFWHVGHRSQK